MLELSWDVGCDGKGVSGLSEISFCFFSKSKLLAISAELSASEGGAVSWELVTSLGGFPGVTFAVLLESFSEDSIHKKGAVLQPDKNIVMITINKTDNFVMEFLKNNTCLITSLHYAYKIIIDIINSYILIKKPSIKVK